MEPEMTRLGMSRRLGVGRNVIQIALANTYCSLTDNLALGSGADADIRQPLGCSTLLSWRG